MQKLTYLFAVLFFSLIIFSYQPTHDPFQEEEGENESSKKEDIQGAIDYYKKTASDIETGEVPYDKLFKAIDIGRERVAERARMRSGPGSITSPVWRERGPNNRGGRTRAIMIDSMDHNRIWIGGVSGGLWRTEDITQADVQWNKLGIYFESLSISDICQDPNDLTTVYASTGESYTGDVRGAGIFKSTDDGATWTLLPSTTGSTNSLAEVNEIYVHTNGDIYAATSQGGLLRSQDGGAVWQKVAGTSINSATSNNFHDFFFNSSNQTFYTCNDNDIMKSTTGNKNEWFSIGRNGIGFMSNVSRIEFALCPSNPDVIYAIGAVGSFSSNTFTTKDGGANWASRAVPDIFGGYGQAWYDLDLAVDPTNCFRILAGGVVLSESTFQGFSWSSISGNVHSDHHNITFDPDIPGRVLFSNDGGIWFSTDGGQTTVDKSLGYVTTQFYACSIHPDPGSPYIIGGTQDNNSLIIDEAGLSPSRVATGGDGIFCFIDQTTPNIQIVSSQGGQYSLSTNGGQSFGFGASINGEFINRSGYDSRAHILYGQNNDSDFFRWDINTGQVDNVDISNYPINVSAVLADPLVPNRIYFGGGGGRVVRVDNANTGLTVAGASSYFADLPAQAPVSCIYMDKQTPNDALISLFNFGASLKNIWLTQTAGTEWHSIEGDLPDLPVRWAIFDPADHDKAMIATDAGVWATDDIDGDNTHWVPTNPDNGMPFVRVDMLVMRDTDKVVLAGTYGRGLMTTDVFAAPAAVIVTQPIAYEGQNVLIDGTSSVNAQTYSWDLGDFTTSTEPKVNHTYTAPGKYNIRLFINDINDSLKQTKSISILPYLPAPYQSGESTYAGDFETKPEHFAAYSPAGSKFTRGISTKVAKDGTHSGVNAWVLDINNALYQNNTRAELYTPMYDLSVPGLYELKFWAKYAVENRNDGFQVEYSLNGGASWTQLGTKDDIGWYNYHNTNLTDGAFPVGKSYFTNAQLNWTQYIKDVSFLVGQAHVSFRFVFRSDASGPAQGLAIDDFEVTKFEGDLRTSITTFSADYTGDQEVTMNWTTGIEYLCQKIYLLRSYNGIAFDDTVNVFNAKGVVSTFPHSYTTTIPEIQDVIYYYLRAENYNAAIPDSYYEVFSDTIIVRRNVEPDVVKLVVTNPFKDKIYVSFTSNITETLSARLFDMSGQLVREDVVVPHSVLYTMDGLDLPQGVYMLSIQVGDGEIKSYKLLTLGDR